MRVKSEREALVKERQEELAKIKALSSLIPICAWCKKVRDNKGYWQVAEQYISEHSQADFTHSLCSDCYNIVMAEKDSKRNVGTKKVG